jgi:hypothetical protein
MPGIVQLAKHLDHAAGGLLEARRLFDQLDAHHLPRLGLAWRAGDQDVLADALVFRRDDPHAAFIEQAPDDVGVGALDHFDDRAFRTAAAVGAGHARHHAVAVQHLLHLFIVEEEVFAALLGDHEAEAVAVGADAAGNEACLLLQRVAAGIVHADLAVARHCVQAPFEHFACGRLDLECARERICVERRAGSAEDGEDFLAAGNDMGRLLQIVSLLLWPYIAPVGGASAAD